MVRIPGEIFQSNREERSEQRSVKKEKKDQKYCFRNLNFYQRWNFCFENLAPASQISSSLLNSFFARLDIASCAAQIVCISWTKTIANYNIPRGRQNSMLSSLVSSSTWDRNRADRRQNRLLKSYIKAQMISSLTIFLKNNDNDREPAATVTASSSSSSLTLTSLAFDYFLKLLLLK